MGILNCIIGYHGRSYMLGQVMDRPLSLAKFLVLNSSTERFSDIVLLSLFSVTVTWGSRIIMVDNYLSEYIDPRYIFVYYSSSRSMLDSNL